MEYTNNKLNRTSSDVVLRGPVFAATNDGIIAAAQQVKDYEWSGQKFQSAINKELSTAIANIKTDLSNAQASTSTAMQKVLKDVTLATNDATANGCITFNSTDGTSAASLAFRKGLKLTKRDGEYVPTYDVDINTADKANLSGATIAWNSDGEDTIEGYVNSQLVANTSSIQANKDAIDNLKKYKVYVTDASSDTISDTAVCFGTQDDWSKEVQFLLPGGISDFDGVRFYYKKSDGVTYIHGAVPGVDLLKQLLEGLLAQTSTLISDLKTSVANLVKFNYEVVTALPTTGVLGTIYLIAHAHTDTNVASGAQEIYDEYIWVPASSDGTRAAKFEKIGNTDVNLSGYVAKTELDAELGKSTTIKNINTQLGLHSTTLGSHDRALNADKVTVSESSAFTAGSTSAGSVAISLANNTGKITTTTIKSISAKEIDDIVG